MRKLLLCLSAILCFSVECVDNDNTYFSYINNQWIKTDKDGKPVDENDKRVQDEKNAKKIDGAWLYLYLIQGGQIGALDKLNRIIDIQNGLADSSEGERADRSKRTDDAQEEEMIRKLAEHLVDKGHFGYLPIPPCNKRGESNGFTKTMRLEVNEPRSYFVMSGDIADKVREYLDKLASNIRTLIATPEGKSNFDPIQYFCSTDAAAAAAQDMSVSYNTARDAMLEEARKLIADVRDDKYQTDTITFSKSGVKIAAKARDTEEVSDKRTAFTLGTGNTYQETETIILYVNIHKNKVEIDTIFPCKENKAQKEKIIVQKVNAAGTSEAASQSSGRGRSKPGKAPQPAAPPPTATPHNTGQNTEEQTPAASLEESHGITEQNDPQ